MIFDEKYFYSSYQQLTAMLILLSIDFRYNMDKNIHVDCRDKYVYRRLSVINSNVDFIVNSIDFQYNTRITKNLQFKKRSRD